MTKLNFQLYSARNHPPLSATLSALGAAGYAGTEGYGGIYATLDEAGLAALRAELDANGLTMPTGHFGIDLLEGDPAQALRIARILGMESVYCPYLLPDQRPADARGWLAFGERLQKAGAPFREAGLDFGWHNHDFEVAKLEDGSTPLDQILAGGPDLSWEADIAWVVRGGGDPEALIEKYGSRITAVHVKDIAPAGENTDEDGWADVGHGTIAWDRLIPLLRATTCRNYIVEHDNPNDLKRLVTRSIASFNSF